MTDDNDALIWHRVLEASALDGSRPRLVRAGSRRLALYRVGQGIYATDNRCPHAAASLALGELSGEVVSCPRHGWRFNVRTGACLEQAGWDVRTFPTRVVDGWIEVGCEPEGPSEDDLIPWITE